MIDSNEPHDRPPPHSRDGRHKPDSTLRHSLGLTDFHLVVAPLGDPPSALDGPMLSMATLNATLVGKWADRLRLLLHPHQTRIARALYDAKALGQHQLIRQTPLVDDPARLWPAVDALLAVGPVPTWAQALAASHELTILEDSGSEAVRGLPGALAHFATQRLGPPPKFEPVFVTSAPGR